MQFQIELNDTLLEKAQRLTGIADISVLVEVALKALIAKESANTLAKLGGTELNLAPIPRRRT